MDQQEQAMRFEALNTLSTLVESMWVWYRCVRLSTGPVPSQGLDAAQDNVLGLETGCSVGCSVSVAGKREKEREMVMLS